MAFATIRQLAAVKRKVSKLEREITAKFNREVSQLPARFGFKSVAAFIAAVKVASERRRIRRGWQATSRMKSPTFSLDNRLDVFRVFKHGRNGVNSATPSLSASSKSASPAASAAVTYAVDLFAGAGGFSLAARNLGVRVVAAVENNRAACATYRRNFIKWRRVAPKLYEEDLTSLSPELLQKECFPPGAKCDVIMGGPPCQGFSVHRINGAGVDDPRNGLLLRYFGFVRSLQPTAFVLENVPGMLWPRHADYVKKFYALADESGYDVHQPVVLNAKDFGVPQNRKRVFVLGVKRGVKHGIVWPPVATHFAPDALEVTEQGRPQWRTAKEIFSKGLRKDDPNRDHMHSCEALVEVFRSTPKNGGSRHESGRKLKCHEDHDGHKDVYGRIDPSHPGPTMTTACINPSKGRFVHPYLDHGIAARHAARFQGFPEKFIFAGGLMAAGVQIGNAVPVPLGEAVLETVLAGIATAKLSSQAA